MATNSSRSGAVRKLKKGPSVGTGGHGRKALEGKGPTPKASERTYHKAFKNKELAERSAAKHGDAPRGVGRPRSGPKGRATEELVTGRNSVVEALRAGIPAKVLYVAVRVDMDERVRESIKLAAERGIPLLEAQKPELDRLTEDAIHQGLVLQIPPYEYEDAVDMASEVMAKWKKGHIANAPLIVALDGITDTRNLGAIIRSVSAFS
ncbi:MAG: RNA methyltransferase substrate-binding domain-containing protein, partial [Specibacter sp.]